MLSYFETLCVDTNAANVLINSSLTILFIRMLRNARAPTLRIRLASVLGAHSPWGPRAGRRGHAVARARVSCSQ